MPSLGGLRDIYKAARRLPPHVLIKKISSRLQRDYERKKRYDSDQKSGSYGAYPQAITLPSYTNYKAFQTSKKPFKT